MGSFIHPWEAFETCNYPEYVLLLQKERKVRQKSNKFTVFVKTGVEVSKVITQSLKKTVFGTSILFDTYP